MNLKPAWYNFFSFKKDDLNGHIDLWDKGKVITYNLFDRCDKMEFWKVSN